MTDLLTVLVGVLLRLCCDRGRKKGVQFHLPYDHCRVCHKTEVLLCVLILSFLDTSICIGAVDTAGLQDCLEKMRPIIQKSDALLYAPSIEKGEIGENCKMVSLNCYLVELKVILFEEGIGGTPDAQCIHHFIIFLESLTTSSQASSSDSCPPCEAQPLKNATIFLDRMFSLLQRMYEHNVNKRSV